MDPERIHSYLQAACAGLGFDIGEVWFSSVDSSSAIVDCRIGKESSALESNRTISFLQLYTSKSYGDPDDLIKPESDEGEQKKQSRKHVLSPTLVNAIATNAQVVWANCQKKEGLLGKSDMRLQTAVGMPVAMDCYGNMCIVVMFSLKSVQSSKEAMEFIKLISQGAASTKIPCMLPVIDSTQKRLDYNPQEFREWQKNDSFLQQFQRQRASSTLSTITSNSNGTSTLQRDMYGIPILPDFAELLTESENENNSTQKRLSLLSKNSETAPLSSELDSTFALWSTIMTGPSPTKTGNNEERSRAYSTSSGQFDFNWVDPKRKVRLEEFVTAFLGFSLFDIADVWAPLTDANGLTSLYNVFAANSEGTDLNPNVVFFANVSRSTKIQPWSGAVGRAYSTGSAVWSSNADLIVDSERKNYFYTTNISTVLTLPISSHNAVAPSCIISFYSLLRTDSSTFVLKFLQQALNTLWEGLDSVEPPESIGIAEWQDVSPANIGEMAADVELQRALYNKKRRNDIMEGNVTSSSSEASSLEASPVESEDRRRRKQQRTSSFLYQMQSLQDESSKDANVSVQSPTVPTEDLFFLQNSGEGITSEHQYGRDVPNGFVKGTNGTNLNAQQNQASPQPVGNSIVELDSSLSNLRYCFPLVSHPKEEAKTQIPTTSSSSSKNKLKICRIEGCNETSIARRPYCSRHSGNRLCEYPGGCTKCAQGATRFCIAHGGGRRCTFPGCDKGARDKFFCAAHGGGKRCSQEGCNKSAVGGSKLCTLHGGGRRCSVEGCFKSAQSSTKFCVRHGGGKKCSKEGCNKVARGRTPFCASHGGGVRCKLDGCNRIAIGKLQLCRAHGGGSGKSKSKKGAQKNNEDLNVQNGLQTQFQTQPNPPATLFQQHIM